MTDTSLDDFFAKKDKSKKGKSKMKYTTSDTIAKKLEDSGKRSDITSKFESKEKVPLSSNNQSILIPSIANDHEDDEWTNIEEKETDYSGLRIQALSISDREKEEAEQLKEQFEEGDGSRQGEGGPWKLRAETESQPPPQEKPSVVEEVKEPVTTGTYRPPAMRNAPPPSSTPGRRGRAPELNSEIHFPSLSSASDPNWNIKIENDRSFQAVKHGARSRSDHQGVTAQLDLENKYSALHQGE